MILTSCPAQTGLNAKDIEFGKTENDIVYICLVSLQESMCVNVNVKNHDTKSE